VLDFVFAYAAGLLTLINPCVLPLLPLIAAGAVARHPLGPVAMAGGLAASFTVAGVGIYALTRATGIAQEDISVAAGWVMVAFGGVLLIPQAQEGFARLAGAVAGGGSKMIGQVEGQGLWGEAAAGGLMGLAWSPCIGPTLGAAIGLAAQGESLIYAFFIMLLFSAGSATVILALAYGARSLVASRRDLLVRIAPYARRVLGIGLIVVGLAIVFHLDQVAEGWALDNLPYWFTDLSVSL
jgi:cytochrome c biogenesis protein CcdA